MFLRLMAASASAARNGFNVPKASEWSSTRT